MKRTADEVEWARRTIAAEDYLPWADVERAKLILGLPIDGLSEEELAAYNQVVTKQAEAYQGNN